MQSLRKQAGLGFRAHSGWFALVAVSLGDEFPVPLLRERPQLVKTFTFAFRQPYHSAEKKPLEEARDFIERMRTEATGLALDAIQSARSNLAAKSYEVEACGLLASSARPLPDLARILASHPLIHTADGELFREALREACKQLGLPVLAIRESELLERAARKLQLSSSEINERLTQLGRALGSPWTQDEKFATLAAFLACASRGNRVAV